MESTIELHIDELVLHGFPAIDRPLLQVTIQQELTRLFVQQGIPSPMSAPLERNYLRAEGFQVAPQSSVETLGSQIAQSVYSGIVP